MADRPFTQYDQFIEPTQQGPAGDDNRPSFDNITIGNNKANNSGTDMPMSPTEDPRDTGDQREIQDNGTQNAHFSCGGLPYTPTYSGENPAPDRDSNQAEVADYGLNEGVEVGCDCSIANYGLVGESPAAGGGIARNKMD